MGTEQVVRVYMVIILMTRISLCGTLGQGKRLDHAVNSLVTDSMFIFAVCSLWRIVALIRMDASFSLRVASAIGLTASTWCSARSSTKKVCWSLGRLKTSQWVQGISPRSRLRSESVGNCEVEVEVNVLRHFLGDVGVEGWMGEANIFAKDSPYQL